MIYVVKHTFFRHFFQTSKSDGLPFLGQLRQKGVIYLKRKPYYPSFESRFETGKISVMKGSTEVLVKVVLFQLKGPGHPQNDAMFNLNPYSKNSMTGLLNEVSFVSEFFQEDDQNSKCIFQKTCCTKIYVYQ